LPRDRGACGIVRQRRRASAAGSEGSPGRSRSAVHRERKRVLRREISRSEEDDPQAMSSDPQPKASLRYRRILLKISGEALMGARDFGLDWETVRAIAEDIRAVHHLGAELAVVI